jgi:rhomboid protease GluP
VDDERGAAGTTAAYLAGRMCAEKGYRPGTVPEAQALADAADLVLTKADGLAFTVVCIVDREARPERRFPLTLDAVVAVARGCVGYTGKINGVKMPVTVHVWEVGRGAGGDDEWQRLRQLSRRLAGADKVIVSAWAIDPAAAQVKSTIPFNGLLAGRRHLERLLREPRRRDDEVVAPAATREHTGPPLVTIALLAVLALAFAGELSFGVRPWTGALSPDISTLVAAGGLFAPAVRDGEWHRFFAAIFLHAGLFHLVLNGVALFLAGYVLEMLLGRAWLLALFVAGGLGGSALSYALNPADVVSVGASGAIMGLLAAALLSSFRLPSGAERLNVQMRLGQFLVPALIPLFTHRAGGHVDYAAHLGGAIVGTLAGVLLMRTWARTDPLPPLRPAARAIAGAGALALVATGVLVARSYGTYAAASALAPESELTATEENGTVARAQALVERYPHDPRVRWLKANLHYRGGDNDAAIAELRLALNEHQMLENVFADRQPEIRLRGFLASLLRTEGKTDEARATLAPVCHAGPGGQVPDVLVKLELCD